ncbi:MAG: hypothetical protein LRY73_03395 [Bacillus sp. (in: Bacteria)]|nr:hypothetical protein [Bacillus sp. (in: firmicutes)]
MKEMSEFPNFFRIVWDFLLTFKVFYAIMILVDLFTGKVLLCFNTSDDHTISEVN